MNTNAIAFNNIIYDCNIAIETRELAYIYNNTLVNNHDTGLKVFYSSGSTVVKNNLLQNNTLDYDLTGTAPISSFNITSDDSSPDGVNHQNISVNFIDPINNNYHLDLSEESNYLGENLNTIFTYDIDGDNRNNWFEV